MLNKKKKANTSVYHQDKNAILKSVSLVTERDHWVYKNSKAFSSLMKGIKDAKEGRLHDLGSFSNVNLFK